MGAPIVATATGTRAPVVTRLHKAIVQTEAHHRIDLEIVVDLIIGFSDFLGEIILKVLHLLLIDIIERSFAPMQYLHRQTLIAGSISVHL